jgi:YidC/Oxa1 family membrane protein insertase
LAEIQNPNQQGGGGQDMRTVLAFTSIFFLIFLALQYFRAKKPAEQPVQQQVASTPAPTSSTPAPASIPATITPSATTPAVAATNETETVVENELYRIRFTNRGAHVTSWVLKKYTDSAGKPLDLVNRSASKFGYPLSVYTYDQGLNDQLSKALYVPSSTGNVTVPGTLSFRYAENGIEATKTFRFDSSYVLHADVLVARNGSPVRSLVAWPSGLGDQDTNSLYASGQFDWNIDGKTDHARINKVSGGATLNGNYSWAGISDLYFAAIFLPDDPSSASVMTLHNTISVPRDPKNPSGASDQASVLGAAMGDINGHTRLRIFAGPKQLDVLSTVRAMADGNPTGPTLEPLVQFGWMGFIAKPLFLALRWLYDHGIGNWGWAILIVTLILNLAMLPTRLQMMKSALKMQRIQPKMEAIKAKYRNLKLNDPKRQQMNVEIMDMQRKEGINMFGGCLPMLIQFPLLYAFYRMLSNVIELRHANWLWLPDLSSPDPLHLLPLFVIVSMFLVQFLTPSPGMDPAQQRMMAFTMPAVFGFTMWHVASGLALYWAFGNLINLVMQVVMNRTKMGREMREIAARRAAKRLGGAGKTIQARR